MSRLASVGPRLDMLRPQLGSAGQGKPWQKTALTPKRALSGQQRKRRNDRIKLRDRFKCQQCGKTRQPEDLEVDHRIPLSEGGTEQDNNLQSLCAGIGQCHHLKTIEESKRGAGSCR